jgi:hypothetical protein
MSDACDSAQRVAGILACGVHLADDRVLGPFDGGQCGHRGADAVAAVVMAHRLQRSGWVGQPQFGCLGE